MIRLLFLILAFTTNTYAQSDNYNIYDGDIDGAPYKVVVPDNWESGKVFFHVHGWRPPDAPHVADLDMNNPFYQNLIDDGWIIGRTAFQENGTDHEAHTQELYKLRDWINENAGTVELLILEGESTAGTLLLHIAERNPDLASGVIAKGAFIELNDETSESYLEARPEIPAVLMSNLTELDSPVSYAAAAENAPVPPSLRPLMRPGHVNLNWAERLDAFKYLHNLIEGGKYSPISDGTRSVPDRSTGTIHKDRVLENKVTSIDPFFGNAILDFHPDEFADIGIKHGYQFIFEIHNKQRNVFYGQSFGDVEQGEWVAFPTADDRILIARNHDSAIKTANIAQGDTVWVKPID